MTQEQINKLCELEPKRFYLAHKKWLDWEIREDMTASDYGFTVNGEGYPYYVNRKSMCFWMLTRLPDVCLSAPIKSSLKWHCEDSRLDRYSGSGDTAEDAIIDAYIQWLESKVNNK